MTVPADPPQRPTMRDIAERVGLSRQLVSIVLRGAPGASDESRARVLAVARELGYHPDDSARMLRRRRSGQLGVLFTMRRPFEMDLVDALYRQASERGFSLALGTMSRSRSQHEALGALMRQRIEALIVLDAQDVDELLEAAPAGLPVLLLGGPAARSDRDAVRVENAVGIAAAVEHLTALGHSRIAYAGPESGPNASERLTAYRESMIGRALAPEALAADPTEEGGYRAARKLLQRLGRDPNPALGPRSDRDQGCGRSQESPTALICINDHCATGALHTLVRAGIRVPEDISILGFDDSTAAALPFVELTSVRPDSEQMARLAVEQVLRRLEDPDAPLEILRVTPSLTVRASTAPPAS